MTKTERTAVARTLSCTRCGVAENSSCRKMNGHPMGFREPMKGVHEERLEAADRLLAKMEEEGNDS